MTFEEKCALEEAFNTIDASIDYLKIVALDPDDRVTNRLIKYQKKHLKMKDNLTKDM